MNSYSQHNEDTYIDHLCRLHGIDLPKTVIEIGACDGLRLSNSRYFIEYKGFEAICVEPNPFYYDQLKLLYAKNRKVICVKAAISGYDGVVNMSIDDDRRDSGHISDAGNIKVVSMPYEKLLNKCNYENREIGVLSIDTEGEDAVILADAINTENMPYFIVIESNEPKHRQLQIDIFKHYYDILNVLSVNLVLVKKGLVKNFAL